MALGQGRVKAYNDFTAAYDGITVSASSTYLGGGFSRVGVNEGSLASTVDESGGILAITTDTGDNDNDVIVAGKFWPKDGTISFEGRFKYSNVDCAIFAGFTETLALDTPVMPAEFATATMTYNGTGGMTGIQYDVDGTTDDFRAVMGDAGANSGGTASANGVRANADVTADQWMEFQIILFPDGSSEVYFGSAAVVQDPGNTTPKLQLVKKYAAGLDPTNGFFAVLMIENRSGAARVLETDYVKVFSGRDWNYD